MRRVTNSFLGQMQTITTCPTCNGEGQVIANKCKSCQGSGTQQGEEVISINIPAGVGEGMQLTVSGKGNAAERGGIPGRRRRKDQVHKAFAGDGPFARRSKAAHFHPRASPVRGSAGTFTEETRGSRRIRKEG